MKTLSLQFLLLALMVAQGCARLTPEVKITAEPDPAYAYFYGQLELNDTSGFYVGNAEIALRLQHAESRHTVTMRYKTNNPVTAVRVKPGPYVLQSVMFLDNFNSLKPPHFFMSAISASGCCR